MCSFKSVATSFFNTPVTICKILLQTDIHFKTKLPVKAVIKATFLLLINWHFAAAWMRLKLFKFHIYINIWKQVSKKKINQNHKHSKMCAPTPVKRKYKLTFNQCWPVVHPLPSFSLLKN